MLTKDTERRQRDMGKTIKEKQAFPHLKKLVNQNFENTNIRMRIYYSNCSEKVDTRRLIVNK